MPHGHEHTPRNVSRKLIIAAAANLAFVAVELAAGFYANSLALIGDAFHNFTDVLALLIALYAVRLERRPATGEKTYGYQRAGTLAAFINAGALVALTLFLVVEAVERFRTPAAVNETVMMITAAVAVVINGAIPLSLRREGRHDVNIRTAVLHMTTDAISSAGVIAAALMIRTTGSAVWDPAITILIAVLILWSSWGILRETVNMLLEGTPAGIDPAAVTRSLGTIEGVQGVHHLHIWALGPSRPALSCHLMVGDVPVKSTSQLLDQITGMLHRDYRIVHVTVQFEFAECAADDPYCVPYSATESRTTPGR